MGDLPESSRRGNGSNAAAIEYRTGPDTDGYTPGLIPCFSFIYATWCYAVGCTRTRLRGLKIRVLRRSVGSSPTAPTDKSPAKHEINMREKCPVRFHRALLTLS